MAFPLPRSLPRRAARPVPAFRSMPGRLVSGVRRLKAPAALQRLMEIPLTFLGVACIDAGVYTQSLTAGLIVTGLSLIGLEYLIADEG